jgi:hypothetical protein
MLRDSLSFAALALLLTVLSPVQAQTIQSASETTPSEEPLHYRPRTVERRLPKLRTKSTGLLTTQLSAKELVRWKTIEQLVFAQTKTGELLHPVLHELWRWADNSGHIIQVQLVDSKMIQSSTAGSFNIEQFDPTGHCHVTSLKLYLSNIDQAVIGPQVARPNGFIPFEALSKEERYAEVLGHELAHVKYVLNNIMRTRLVHELVETTNQILLLHARSQPAALTSSEMKRRLTQRDELLRELEMQAEAIEEVVWRELISSKYMRVRLTAAMKQWRR